MTVLKQPKYKLLRACVRTCTPATRGHEVRPVYASNLTRARAGHGIEVNPGWPQSMATYYTRADMNVGN